MKRIGIQEKRKPFFFFFASLGYKEIWHDRENKLQLKKGK